MQVNGFSRLYAAIAILFFLIFGCGTKGDGKSKSGTEKKDATESGIGQTQDCGIGLGDDSGIGISEAFGKERFVKKCLNKFSFGDVNCINYECSPDSLNNFCPDLVEEICRLNGGKFCDSDDFISPEEAAYIAEWDRFEHGILCWEISLIFNHDYNTVIIRIDNYHTYDPCDASGSSLVLYATTGEILSRDHSWGHICRSMLLSDNSLPHLK
jgi:hypothetical protein